MRKKLFLFFLFLKKLNFILSSSTASSLKAVSTLNTLIINVLLSRVLLIREDKKINGK